MPGDCISSTRSVPNPPPKTIVPLSRVWSPSKARLAAAPVRLTVPFRVTALKRRAELLFGRLTSTSRVTPSRRFAELAVATSAKPGPPWTTCMPWMVPPPTVS